jgi:hypothetical protein
MKVFFVLAIHFSQPVRIMSDVTFAQGRLSSSPFFPVARKIKIYSKRFQYPSTILYPI